jgi:hypothetical protein
MQCGHRKVTSMARTKEEREAILVQSCHRPRTEVADLALRFEPYAMLQDSRQTDVRLPVTEWTGVCSSRGLRFWFGRILSRERW